MGRTDDLSTTARRSRADAASSILDSFSWSGRACAWHRGPRRRGVSGRHLAGRRSGQRRCRRGVGRGCVHQHRRAGLQRAAGFRRYDASRLPRVLRPSALQDAEYRPVRITGHALRAVHLLGPFDPAVARHHAHRQLPVRAWSQRQRGLQPCRREHYAGRDLQGSRLGDAWRGGGHGAQSQVWTGTGL